MKKFICAVLIIMMMAISGCYSSDPISQDVRRRAQQNKNVETTTGSTSQASGADILDYPNTESHLTSWKDSVNDGYTIDVSCKVWNPAKLERSYKHPGNSGKIINDHEVEERTVWVIPFEISMKNETSGFGETVYKSTIVATKDGGSDYSNYIAFGNGYTNKEMKDNEDESYYKNRDDYYMLVYCFMSDSTNVKPYYYSFTATLNEGQQSTLYGYLLFVDKVGTPNNPSGSSVEDLEQRGVLGGCSLRLYCPDAKQSLLELSQGKIIANITKNSSDKLIFSE